MLYDIVLANIMPHILTVMLCCRIINPCKYNNNMIRDINASRIKVLQHRAHIMGLTNNQLFLCNMKLICFGFYILNKVFLCEYLLDRFTCFENNFLKTYSDAIRVERGLKVCG